MEGFIMTVNSINNNSTTKATANQNTSTAERIIAGQYSGQSDEQLWQRMLDLARKDSQTGNNSRTTINGKRTGSNEFIKLRDDYIFANSGDRKGSINNTISGLKNKLNVMQIKFNSINFFQMLFKNSHLFGTRDIGMNFINFRNAAGEKIAKFNSDTGWEIFPTAAENARSQDFFEQWERAGQAVHNTDCLIKTAAEGFDIDIAALKAAGTPLDMKELAAHGITYCSKTGQTSINRELLDSKTANIQKQFNAKRTAEYRDEVTDSIIRNISVGFEVDLAVYKAQGVPLNMERLAESGITFDSETGKTIVDMALVNKGIAKMAENGISYDDNGNRIVNKNVVLDQKV
jgi:hypothetical protein